MTTWERWSERGGLMEPNRAAAAEKGKPCLHQRDYPEGQQHCEVAFGKPSLESVALADDKVVRQHYRIELTMRRRQV